MNAWLARGGEAYVDVGILHGYREAIHVFEERPADAESWRPSADGAAVG